MSSQKTVLTQRIVEHLVKRYHPRAIILHGSRAKGLHTLRADWDIHILCHKRVKIKAEEFEGQHLDIDAIHLPLASKELFIHVGSSWRDAVVLLDDEQKTGQKLLKSMRALYKRGKHLSQAQLETKHQYLKRLLTRLEDNLHQPEIFFLHLGHFYNAAYNYWFDTRNEWTRPIYEAFPEIEKRDPVFTKHLLTIAGEKNNKIKLRSAKEIYKHLFVD